MNKRLKMLMVALGVAAILVISFASVAMAAGPAGSMDRAQDCILDGVPLQECDPVKDQVRGGIKLNTQVQDCDLVPDPTCDPIQQRSHLNGITS